MTYEPMASFAIDNLIRHGGTEEQLVGDFVRALERDGVVETRRSLYTASRNLAGMPTVQHDDARFAESRPGEDDGGSMACWYENGGSAQFGIERWWLDDRTLTYYDGRRLRAAAILGHAR